ncbi:MAG: hypothetical protein CMO11_03205 [Thaumarchaeota archaeon]|nr:hypothetical protein [Nitrososphaerota archaeon]
MMIFYLPLALLILYGQKIQSWMMLNDISKSIGKLKEMKEKSRDEAINHITEGVDNKDNVIKKIDSFLEYFTIMPVDLDPAGVVNKLDHLMTTRDERMRIEIKNMLPELDSIKANSVENIIEIATSYNFVYKIARHFYLIGKKSSNILILAQLQMIMPFILMQADALTKAMSTFRESQPIGDSIGPMIVGKLMLEKEKHEIARDTIYAESNIENRKVYLITAKGPGGTVGQPGNALKNIIEKGTKPSILIMIDAALRLEGEKTGEIAEGIGAAIGGIGVDRFKIEEIATENNIPIYAIVIKQTLVEAISIMRKEIAETTEPVHDILNRLIMERTKEGDSVIIIGVGNTAGVGQ